MGLLSLAFVLAGLWMMSSNQSARTYYMGLIAAIFFGLGVLVFLWQLFTTSLLLKIDKQAEILNCGICVYDFHPDADGLCIPKLEVWNHGAPLAAEGAPQTAEPDKMTGTR